MIVQGIETTVRGPLFERPNLVTFEATAKLVQRVVELGEQRLDIVLRPRDTKPGVYITTQQGGKSTGHYRRNVSGQAQGLRGRIDDGGVVYGPWLELGGGRFKGYSAFRKTTQWMEEQVPKEATKMVQQLARKMNK